jgi:hypothetical protein
VMLARDWSPLRAGLASALPVSLRESVISERNLVELPSEHALPEEAAGESAPTLAVTPEDSVVTAPEPTPEAAEPKAADRDA